MSLTNQIRLKAKELGFAKIGFERAEPLPAQNGLLAWLAAGHQGEMSWMERAPEKRLDPGKVLPGVRSVIALAMNYATPHQHSSDPACGKISRYAWGGDYHLILKERLKQLLAWIQHQEPGAMGLVYSDTGPMMDKVWAHQSGLGWIGKHSNLITRDLGSWVFLGEILLNLELEFDQESGNYCGSCRHCLDVCPTQAILAPYWVDARRCLAYLTIELRGPIPIEFRSVMGSRIFGCDDCQEICPWNRFACPTAEKEFMPAEGNLTPVLSELLQLTEPEFNFRFKASPVKRARYDGFLRNVAVALGNSGNPHAVPVLAEALSHASPLVRGHAAWALSRYQKPAAREALNHWSLKETDPYVRGEIRRALSKPLECGGKRNEVAYDAALDGRRQGST